MFWKFKNSLGRFLNATQQILTTKSEIGKEKWKLGNRITNLMNSNLYIRRPEKKTSFNPIMKSLIT